jgi:hypothetical protein
MVSVLAERHPGQGLAAASIKACHGLLLAHLPDLRLGVCCAGDEQQTVGVEAGAGVASSGARALSQYGSGVCGSRGHGVMIVACSLR